MAPPQVADEENDLRTGVRFLAGPGGGPKVTSLLQSPVLEGSGAWVLKITVLLWRTLACPN